jgi:hypothetical protein
MALIAKTKNRCKFFNEFVTNVLSPLKSTSKDPFHGKNVDINAFGWGFATASSRAIRSVYVDEYYLGLPKYDDLSSRDLVMTTFEDPIMVPGIDLTFHSYHPNSIIVYNRNKGFYLVALQDIDVGSVITTNYGNAITNEDFVSDYGFSLDNNRNDYFRAVCDVDVINSARLAMGQTTTLEGNLLSTPSMYETTAISSLLCEIQDENYDNTTRNELTNIMKGKYGVSISPGKVGRGSELFSPQWLFHWQVIWLRALGLMDSLNSNMDYTIKVGYPDLKDIDGR